MDFQGKPILIAALDAALSAHLPKEQPSAVAQVLRRLFADPRVRLPAQLKATVDGHYARRELHLSPSLGYSVVAMAWAPGQGTPLHDHDGAWCVEGVWQGRLQVQDYELSGHEGQLCRFKRGSCSQIALGQTGLLSPPGEHHVVHNPDPQEVAVSIHVYQRRLLRCHVYLPEDEQPNQESALYRRQVMNLAVD